MGFSDTVEKVVTVLRRTFQEHEWLTESQKCCLQGKRLRSAGDNRFTSLKPGKIRQCVIQCGLHFRRVVPGFKEQPFDFQYLVGPMGLAVHATHKIVFVEQGQRELAVATFRWGDVTFQLVVEGKQIG